MLFKETQSLNILWFRVSYFLFNAGLISFLLVSMFEEENAESRDEILIALVLMLLVNAGVFALVFLAKAHTRIDDKGIHIIYKPFILKWKVFKWSDLSRAVLIDISPVKHFGGWGYRVSMRHGKGVILSKGRALLIETKAGKRFTITTKKEKEMTAILQQAREVQLIE